MEARITRLQEDVRDERSERKAIRDLLTDIRIELARKPNTGAMWGMVATVLGVGIAIAGLTFAVAG